MIRIEDEIQNETITFNFVENKQDAQEAFSFAASKDVLGFDTESTGLNCFHPEWKLRTFQFSDAYTSYVIPASRRKLIYRLIYLDDVKWIGFNGPHDIRCIDQFFGYKTGMQCAFEVYIMSHHFDPRKFDDGGIGYGLKDRCTALVDPESGKWEVALKQSFKMIMIPMPGEVYKSGPRRGMPKMRKALISEGWKLQDIRHPAYIAYAAADPILTYRLKEAVDNKDKSLYKSLYKRDKKIDDICDTLNRRGLRVDTGYTIRYRTALFRRAAKYETKAVAYGCLNIYSGEQVTSTLQSLGAKLTERTRTGKWKSDDGVMKHQAETGNKRVQDFARCILTAKRLSKRAEVYADGMLRELGTDGRVHPSINSLAARTGRMSAGIFQQLPTKDDTE